MPLAPSPPHSANETTREVGDDHGAEPLRPVPHVPGVDSPFAARGAELLWPVVRHEVPTTPTARATTVSLRGLFTAVLLAVATLGASVASRALPEWEEGRWWVLTTGLDAVGLLSAVTAVVLGVSALGQIARQRPLVRGAVPATAGLALGCALVVVTGAHAVDDWRALDVPRAWERLRPAADDAASSDLTDAADLGAAAPNEALRTQGQPGLCYAGTAGEPGAKVGCAEPHRIELLDQIALDLGAGEDPANRRETAIDQCRDVLVTRLGAAPTTGALDALVPDDGAWGSGDRRAQCLVAYEKPVVGAFGP